MFEITCLRIREHALIATLREHEKDAQKRFTSAKARFEALALADYTRKAIDATHASLAEALFVYQEPT